MVGVVNPNANTSLERHRQLAEQSTFVLVPGEDWPSEGVIPSGVATTTSAPSSTATGAPATSAVPPPPSHAALSPGAIAGIAIGGSAVLLAAAVAIWFCGRQSRRHTGPAPGAPAQEIHPGYNPHMSSMYGKSGHMSVSGYTMPPGYDQSNMHSPTMPTAPAHLMAQEPTMLSAAPSPHLQSASPVSNHASTYAVGTHMVAPVEMDGGSHLTNPPRRSTEKQGVERYS
ncbi:hypothetical protein LTR05_003238 [Lithohypha guttulata]|uniref:Uncharacterized protein n=2 Tax=Lithohypha guttulata TaxID=1690604 RepID=A0AAN7T6B8_9EURO|nr:hypothetical protein LTR05_003238 [Lithohypha guttulata]